MNNFFYTPEDLARMKAQMEQIYTVNTMQNQNMNTVANMTKNISPLGNLGIALGTLLGKWGAQQYNNVNDNKLFDAYEKYRRKLDWQPNFENAVNRTKNWLDTSLFDADSTPTTPALNNAPAPSTSLFNKFQSYDWRNNLRLNNSTNNFFNNSYSGNQPATWQSARYPNGALKNSITAYNPIDN